MALVTTPATILKTYQDSETSKILRLLTLDRGLCSVVAKGARRPRSRFGGLLEPFTDGVVTYYAKEGRDLHTLSEFELGRERQSLGRQLVRYAGAGLVTEITLRFAPATGDEGLFRRLRAALDRLVEESGDLEAAILEETWQLIACLGFAPGIDVCAACGERPEPGETIHFDFAAGSSLCVRCHRLHPQLGLRELSRRAREELEMLIQARSGGGRLKTGREQRALLSEFMTYHLTDDRPLKSFRFLEDRLG